jgi:hypothetical protein
MKQAVLSSSLGPATVYTKIWLRLPRYVTLAVWQEWLVSYEMLVAKCGAGTLWSGHSADFCLRLDLDCPTTSLKYQNNSSSVNWVLGLKLYYGTAICRTVVIQQAVIGSGLLLYQTIIILPDQSHHLFLLGLWQLFCKLQYVNSHSVAPVTNLQTLCKYTTLLCSLHYCGGSRAQPIMGSLPTAHSYLCSLGKRKTQDQEQSGHKKPMWMGMGCQLPTLSICKTIACASESKW